MTWYPNLFSARFAMGSNQHHALLIVALLVSSLSMIGNIITVLLWRQVQYI